MADSLSKLGSMLESARELTLEAASSASARLMDDFPPQSKDISNMLNGRTERERLTGLKHVIGIMATGGNAVEYFPDVVKNIASSSLEARRLVYIYLLRYSEFEPDLALLSINTIQKSLSDKSPVVRALAIRVMAAIKVPVLSPIVMLSIKRACRDLSPSVRKATAHAIASCFELDPSSGPTLLELLDTLLVDVDPSVTGAALSVLAVCWPDRLDLVHKVFRRVCRILPQLDEWSQIFICEMLARYGRMFLAKPIGAIGEETEETRKIEETNAMDQFFTKDWMDPDLLLLFEAASLLLYSRNGSLVIAAAKLFFYLGTPEIFHTHAVAGPLVRLLRGDYAMQYIALVNIRNLCLTLAMEFKPFLTYFYLTVSDSYQIAKLKLEVLALLSDKDSADAILSELRYYATTSLDKKITAECMKALARCAIISSTTSKRTLTWLLRQVKSSSNPLVVSESLTAIRFLIQRDVKAHVSTAAKLAMCLDSVTSSEARASIIWLVGEFSPIAYKIAPDVLRLCAKTFTKEEEAVRYQIVLLAAKVYACQLSRLREGSSESDPITVARNEAVKKLFDHVVHLARYDSSYDTRDRTRMFSSLLNSSIGSDIGLLLLQATKPNPTISLKDQLLPADVSEYNRPGQLVLGTPAAVLGAPLDGYQSMIPWTLAADLIGPSVRDEKSTKEYPEPQAVSSKQFAVSATSYSRDAKDRHGLVSNGPKLREQTLDEFFGEPANDESESEEDSEEEESNSEEEESEEESESEEEDNSDSDVGESTKLMH